MPTPVRNRRRVVEYKSLDAFLSDAEQLAASRVITVGKWTYPQILDHLARTIHCSFDGFGFSAPWFIRLIAPLLKNSFLTKPMRAGFRLPKKRGAALLPEGNPVLLATLDNLRAAVARCAAQSPAAPHPALGKLAGQEWVALHLRHAELHMSFVIPDSARTTVEESSH